MTGNRIRPNGRENPRREGRRNLLLLSWLAMALIGGFVGAAVVAEKQTGKNSRGPKETNAQVAADSLTRSFDFLLHLSDAEFEKLDIVELNLAIAREIPACRGLDVARYCKTVDEWAAWVKQEIDRHWYRFQDNPAEYKNSRAYFCALMMCTVIGQDFKVGYDREAFSFAKAEDQFIYGIIDQRRGTCISLPLLYIAIGQRLGYPIRAVALPGHTFCRWDDPEAGERLNIEAANGGGLTDYDDEHYRHWPYEINPRWEKEHHTLRSLTMREHASVMVGSRRRRCSAS